MRKGSRKASRAPIPNRIADPEEFHCASERYRRYAKAITKGKNGRDKSPKKGPNWPQNITALTKALIVEHDAWHLDTNNDKDAAKFDQIFSAVQLNFSRAGWRKEFDVPVLTSFRQLFQNTRSGDQGQFGPTPGRVARSSSIR